MGRLTSYIATWLQSKVWSLLITCDRKERAKLDVSVDADSLVLSIESEAVA